MVVGRTINTCSQERLLRSPMSQVTIIRPTSNSLVLNEMTKEVRAPEIRFRAMPASRSGEIEVWHLEVAIMNTIARLWIEKMMVANGKSRTD